ncbi:MAG: chloride channel protein [Bacteroidales bacterium]|nr:chloride channel protein [Bacteroidales bacterium]
MKERLEKMLRQFLIWRLKHVSQKNFIRALSVLIGIIVGIAAVVIKYSVHFIQEILTIDFVQDFTHVLYFLLPLIGIGLSVIFVHYILKRKVGHGIPSVLHALSKKQGKIGSSNMFSSIITSALTVGFGGSVGLEGPTVATGAAFGSNIGQMFRLDFKQLILLLGAASSAALAAIFKAPIAAVVFAMEVIMIDMTVASVVPLLLASASATVTSMLFLGVDTIYEVHLTESYRFSELPYYILLGIFSGLLAVYFTRVYIGVNKFFDNFSSVWTRLTVGGVMLGILVFVFPSLFGEGFESINGSLEGTVSHIFENTFYQGLEMNHLYVLLFILLVLLFKVLATATTFGAGGVGGIFAPSLFLGSNLGLLFALSVNFFKVGVVNVNHFAFAGMAGLIAANLHAPLTAIFLIGDITGGYQMFIPLMLVSVFAFTTVKLFQPNSVYTIQLAERGELLTHNSDQNILKMMSIEKVIERNFLPINKEAMLGELVKVIAKSSRNIFPVVDNENNFEGVVVLDHVREIMFDRSKYDNTSVEDLMIIPHVMVNLTDKMDDVANKFHESGNYNIPVIDEGKYIGFVSRANVFSTYRRMLKHFSED